MLHYRFSLGLLCLVVAAGTGCVCVQGFNECDSCNSIPMGIHTHGGLLGSRASCRGACGEVYIDEWISQPPTPDNCGYPCGGCGHCQQCQPVRNLLRLLWGRPYVTQCSASACDSGCGCASCEGGCGTTHSGSHGMVTESHGSGCNCGHSGGSSNDMMHSSPIEMSTSPQPLEMVPTPAPAIAPTGAKHLNPAVQKKLRTVSTSRNLSR